MEFLKLPIYKTLTCDVLVVGGGVGGSAAAISAAREGAKTVLIETTGCLGGQATQNIVGPLEGRFSKSGKNFGGMVQELIDETVELNLKYGRTTPSKGQKWEVSSPHIIKYLLLKKAVDAGVDVHFHTTFINCETENNAITAVYVTNKTGILKIVAKTYIDASGDADLVVASGSEYVKGSEPGIYNILDNNNNNIDNPDNDIETDNMTSGLMQPASIFITLGGVDPIKAEDKNYGPIKFGDFGITREKFLNWKYANTPGFEYDENSENVPIPQGRKIALEGNRDGVYILNMSRIVGVDGSDAESLNKGEVIGQLQVIAIIDFVKEFLPGFENSYIIDTGNTIGIRESRRMVGKYVFSGIDALTCKHFDSVIAHGYYPVDIHDPTGKNHDFAGFIKGDYYEIPYECLISKNITNLMACGRCFSADHIAFSSARVQGTCMFTGQACGTAAAICIKNNLALDKIDVKELQNTLKSNGVDI